MIHLVWGDMVLDKAGLWVAPRTGTLDELRPFLKPINIAGYSINSPPFTCVQLSSGNRIFDIRGDAN